MWRHYHRHLRLLPRILVHAYHFIHFPSGRRHLAEWLAHMPAWLERAGFRGEVFADSGGYEVMVRGLRADPLETLGLQLPYRPRLGASLDFPYPPWLPEGEKAARVRVTEAGWRIHAALAPFGVCYPIHAHSRTEAVRWVERLLRVDPEPGCVALGALVPVRSDLRRILRVISAVRGILPDARIHVFGVSASAIPLIAAAGADSADSATFARAALAGRYYAYEGGAIRRVRGVPEEGVPGRVAEGGTASHLAAARALASTLAMLEAAEEAPDDPRAVPRILRSMPWLRRMLRPRAAPRLEAPRRPRAILILPCTATKPYTASPTYATAVGALRRAGLRDLVAIAFLSSKHGLVMEWERVPAYDQIGDPPPPDPPLPAVGWARGRYADAMRRAGIPVHRDLPSALEALKGLLGLSAGSPLP